MLDKLFLKYLNKKGKIAYFVGQIILFALWAYYLLGIAGYSMEEGRANFFIGMVVILVLWGGVCLLLWKEKPDEKTENN